MDVEGASGHIQSEVGLIPLTLHQKYRRGRFLPTQEAEYSFSGFIPTNKQTNKACKAHVRVALGSAAADATGATVDEDDQDDEAVLVAEQQKASSKIMTRR